MKHLNFIELNSSEYEITNKNNVEIGRLEFMRVGAWNSWCLTGIGDTDIYISASCLDEIRDKIKELNSLKK